MANSESLNIDNTQVFLDYDPYSANDELLTSPGEDTLLVGTILARSDATEKLVVFDAGDANADEPLCVLSEEIDTPSSGDVVVRPPRRGKVRRDRLVVYDGGNNDVEDPGVAITDALNRNGINCVASIENAEYDNAIS